jgi:hypothetical protein
LHVAGVEFVVTGTGFFDPLTIEFGIGGRRQALEQPLRESRSKLGFESKGLSFECFNVHLSPSSAQERNREIQFTSRVYWCLPSIANAIEGGAGEIQHNIIATRGLGLP